MLYVVVVIMFISLCNQQSAIEGLRVKTPPWLIGFFFGVPFVSKKNKGTFLFDIIRSNITYAVNSHLADTVLFLTPAQTEVPAKLQTRTITDTKLQSIHHFLGWMRSGIMVNAFYFGSRGPCRLEPGWGHCVALFGKTIYSHSASLDPRV